MSRLPLLAALFVVACGAAAPRASTPLDAERASEAAAGVHDPALAALLREHWEATLAEDPVMGTVIGDHRRDGELPDMSEAGESRRRASRAAFLARARALSVTDPADRLTQQLFVELLEADTGSEVCESHLWGQSPMDNPVVALNRVAPLHALTSPEAAAAYLSRVRAFATLADQVSANLVSGVERGLVAPRATLERLVAMVRRSLEAPVDEWVAMTSATEALAQLAEDTAWPATERAAFVAELRTVLEGAVRPAFVRYADTIETRVLPHGRDAAHEGIASLPRGAECYAAEIRRHTTSTRTAEQIHALGVAEIARTDARMLELGAPQFSVSTLSEVLAHLRSDPSLGYTSSEEIIADATARVREAEARAPEFFTRRATSSCDVVAVPAAEAASQGFAFYVPGTPDGSRPGAYYVNTAEPASRRRHLVAAVTAHEAVPGHHFQITVAQGLAALPAFRRYASFTAYVEGWGLYAERLADQMGLYRDDVDRLGAVDLEAFRGARLVVDTGLHALGWTRAQAEAYLAEHTTMSPDLIVNEVDRYINWPGQALAYKVGQLALLEARRSAEEALGHRFEARAFHDFVLGLGPVSLPVLEREVNVWLAGQR